MNKKNLFLSLSVFVLTIPAIIMIMAMSRQGKENLPPRPKGPCDIYAEAGCPCVAAHSTTRALYASYNGPLYQVMRQSDGKTLDIGLMKPGKDEAGGYADAALQDAFLSGTIGWITKIYDQSGKGNHLMQAPPGTFKGTAKGGFNTLPIADMAPITINGHKAYGVYIIPGMGLRNNNSTGVAINDEPEGIYYVVNGKHFSSGCCFDYGNSSTNSRAVGTGTMETTYYGTATAWGSGNASGPWIMADMEAGLFSGYNAKKNDVPSIDSWQFVSAFVDGGGGNKWDLRGGNAQSGELTTFYSGVRPGTPASNAYFPMNKKGAILLGNGGDNGNGSAGTFYEGVMTTGFPNEATTDAVQANIVSAKYDVQRLELSRITSFTPKSEQVITLRFNNTTGSPINNLKLSAIVPDGWIALVSGSESKTKIFTETIAPNSSVIATFRITSSFTSNAGFLTGKAEWTDTKSGTNQSEIISQRIRNVYSVKINEVRLSTGDSPTNQFIELYNSSQKEIDISNWNIINTQAEWAPLKLGTIPPGTKIAPKSFYLLGLATSGLIAPAKAGENIINVRSTTGIEAGDEISIDGELHKVKNTGTPATALTTLFIPVSTGPWLTIPVGSTNLPVTNATGFTAGQKIGIDIGGNYEIATVTSVGKAATQTNIAIAAKSGDNILKVLDNSNMTVGDILTISTGARKEMAKIKRIIKVYTAPPRGNNNGEAGEVELSAPLKFDHMIGVDVSDKGTGISFSPATKFIHKSGDAVQALGSGITLENKLSKNHNAGAAVINRKNNSSGYQGAKQPQLWYGLPLSATAGSIALMDANNKVVMDALVYGAQQSNSSARGTITSPEIAVLEGDQSQGGCITLPPLTIRGFSITADQSNRSVGRFPDGYDSDNNCLDFQLQNMTSLSLKTTKGSNNIKVSSVEDLSIGQTIIIGSGNNSESAVIASIGTAGGTTVGIAADAGKNVIIVGSVAGFSSGQSIAIGSDARMETAAIKSVVAGRRRFGNNNPTDTITIASPLKFSHLVGEQVSGSGVTLKNPLNNGFDMGAPIANYIPTPGEPNQYRKKN